MLKKIFAGLILLTLLIWGGFCLSVYYFPQRFFYHPSNTKPMVAHAIINEFPAAEVHYTSKDGTPLFGWYVAPKNGKVIVFFHGNSHNIEAFYHKLTPFTEAGYGVLLAEYRGFGGIGGEINQQNLADDSIAAVQYLKDKGFSNKNIILYGMSLGSYTSTYVASTLEGEEAFSGLVLEVPFDSLINVVKQRIMPLFPFKIIIKDKYDNVPLIKKVKAPVFVMGASKDKIVPLERARELFKHIQSRKKMMVYSGAGHSSLYNYRNWRDILDWLKSNEKIK